MSAEASQRPSEEPQPPALAMLHGFALDSRMWRPQVEALANDFRVLTVDLPGFGPQAKALGEVEPAVEVARALDVSGLVRAHFIANSFGAAVAVDFALRFPKRVESLTLLGPTLLGRRTGIEAWARCVTLAGEGDRATAAEIWLDDPLFEGLRVDEQLFEDTRQIVLDYGAHHWTGGVSSKWLDPDPAPRLKEITVPSLVVSGEADIPSFMLMAEAYTKHLGNARREIIPGVGHLANLENPDAFNALLRDFLGRR